MRWIVLAQHYGRNRQRQLQAQTEKIILVLGAGPKLRIRVEAYLEFGTTVSIMRLRCH